MNDNPLEQRNNPLHGQTLEAIMIALVTNYGWAELAARIPIRCFSHEPSLTSSLKFLRKTPWARNRLEQFYISKLPEIKQNSVDK